MTKKKLEGENLSKREIELLKENALLKGKLGFALGVLETVQILTRPVSQEILDKNLPKMSKPIVLNLPKLKKVEVPKKEYLEEQ